MRTREIRSICEVVFSPEDMPLIMLSKLLAFGMYSSTKKHSPFSTLAYPKSLTMFLCWSFAWILSSCGSSRSIETENFLMAATTSSPLCNNTPWKHKTQVIFWQKRQSYDSFHGNKPERKIWTLCIIVSCCNFNLECDVTFALITFCSYYQNKATSPNDSFL